MLHNGSERAKKNTITLEMAKEMTKFRKDKNMTYPQIAAEYGVSAPGVRHALKRYGLV
jgi:DNA-binding GntR family transcriptional regulator